MSGLPHVARSMAAVLLLIFPFALDAQTLPSATQLELAPGTDQAFGYEATTTASPETIWRIWMDVGAWKDWDLGLADAEGSVSGLDAKGVVISEDGRRSPFTVIDYDDGRSYAFSTALPNGALVVRRSIVGTDPTVIRHDVLFEGEGGVAMSPTLGPIFRAALPPTVEAVADRAEGSSP